VTADLKSAIELNEKYPLFNFTTLEGDFVQQNGIVEAGSLPKEDETIFGRRQLLENLKKDLPKHESNLAKLKAAITEKEVNISKIDLKNLSNTEKLIANDISNIEKQISQFEFENNKSNEEITVTQKEIQELAEKSNFLDNQIIGINRDLENLN
jgi:chromosome segregation protein